MTPVLLFVPYISIIIKIYADSNGGFMSSEGGYTRHLSSYADTFGLPLTYRWRTDAKTRAHRRDGNGVSIQLNIDGDKYEGGVHTQDVLRVEHLPSWVLVILLCTDLNLLFVSLEWKHVLFRHYLHAFIGGM